MTRIHSVSEVQENLPITRLLNNPATAANDHEPFINPNNRKIRNVFGDTIDQTQGCVHYRLWPAQTFTTSMLSTPRPLWPPGSPIALTRALVEHHGRDVVALLGPLTLYMLTLAPTVYNLDSAELTTAAATGGLVRATGYPLYLMLGWLWSHIPVGDIAYRMNMLSAVCGALTVLLADRLLRRLGVGPWAALGALGLLTAAPFFWGLSLVAEVYTLHTALVAGLFLLLLRWRERPTPLRFGLVMLLGGLSMGHHLATALLVPACAAFTLGSEPRHVLAPRTLLAGLLGGLLGLSVYLYLPIRAQFEPTFNYVGVYDAAGRFHPADLWRPEQLWWLVTGRSFAEQMLGYDAAGWWREVAVYGGELCRSFLVIGIGPGMLGAAVLLRRDRWLGIALLLSFTVNAAFYISYRVVDKSTMFLPTYLVWAIWAAVGFQRLIDWTLRSRAERTVLRGLLVGAVVVALAGHWPLASRAGDWSSRERVETVLTAVEPGGLLLGFWETIPLVEYVQLVEGRRQDISAINRFLISYDDMLALIAAEVGQRPVYIDNPTVELLAIYRVEQVGPIYRVRLRELP